MAGEHDETPGPSDRGPEPASQQPDPMRSPGRTGPLYQWLAGLFIVGIVLLVLYALNASGPGETAGNVPPAPAQTTGAGSPGH